MFIGREKELNIFKKRIESKGFEFGLIYGRRRIGKTRLLQEIVSKYKAIYFVASEMGLNYNLKQLSATIAAYYNEPFSFVDFESIFKYLAKRSEEKETIFILDEFTYLLHNNKELLSVFQNAIDQYLINSNVKLILSGSHVGMIEDAISYHKPLYGRTTFKIKLEPFDYYDAAKFYPSMSDEDKVRMYSVFGGVPFYTSRIDDSKSVKANIIDLITEQGAIFEDEITFFLTQEVRSVSTYGRILKAIASGATKLNEITTKSGNANSGTVSKHIDVLIHLGIVEKEYCYGEKSNSKKTLYKIKDQLFNFHYSFIEKNLTSKVIMDPNSFYDSIIQPHLDEYTSFEFERVCREFLIRKYKLSIQEIGRYWFNDAKTKQDIEIDIRMEEGNKHYAYECKWTNNKIDTRILNELENKTSKLKNIHLGFFSKAGFDNNLKEDELQLYTVTDLYKETFLN